MARFPRDDLSSGGDEQAMMDKVNMPVLLMPAGNDPENLKEGGDMAAWGLACHGFQKEQIPNANLVKKIRYKT